jgi:hypothetical protein
MAKRKILHKFYMDEISGVDRMAQEGAKTVIMKRDDTTIAKGAFVDAVQVMEAREAVQALWWELYESETAIYDAIWNIQSNPERYPDVQAAVIEALGEYSDKVQEQAADAAAAVPNTDVEKSASNDPAEKSDHSDGDNDNKPNPEENEMEKKELTVEGLTATLEGVNDKLVKAESFGKLNDAEKTHYATLDDAGQAGFLKMDDGARSNVLEKVAASDPVVYTAADGEEFHKSDDPRLVKMARQSDTDRKLAKADRDKAEKLELTKRADDELNNLPGEPEVKVELLKAIDAIEDEAVRKSINEMLKAGNDAQAEAFITKGTKDEPIGDAEGKLNNLAKAYAKENSVSEVDAYNEVLKTDEGSALYTETQQS